MRGKIVVHWYSPCSTNYSEYAVQAMQQPHMWNTSGQNIVSRLNHLGSAIHHYSARRLRERHVITRISKRNGSFRQSARDLANGKRGASRSLTHQAGENSSEVSPRCNLAWKRRELIEVSLHPSAILTSFEMNGDLVCTKATDLHITDRFYTRLNVIEQKTADAPAFSRPRQK